MSYNLMVPYNLTDFEALFTCYSIVVKNFRMTRVETMILMQLHVAIPRTHDPEQVCLYIFLAWHHPHSSPGLNNARHRLY